MSNNALTSIAQNAKIASRKLANLPSNTKMDFLNKLSQNLIKNKTSIFKANEVDLDEAQKLVDQGQIAKSVYKRLAFTDSKFNEMISGVKDVANLPECVGKIISETELDDNLILKQISCPIGVLGVIFEARPDVVVQITALAIKSSNAVILKGGREANNTNIELIRIIKDTISEFSKIPLDSINLITTREEVRDMLALDEYIDLIIPRGSNDLVKFIKNNSRIPVMGHADGICHIYIDKDHDQETALNVTFDSKTNYPAACNAVETLLVHKDTVESFLPLMIDKFISSGVEVRCEDNLINKLGLANVQSTTDEDWSTEYCDMVISIKEVDSMEEAINHINTYGSGHTDCIVTDDESNAEQFLNEVDSSGVYWNASTRFADGYRYGLGAEVGISTNKTHARGPVGIEGLLIYKYKLYGNGNIVEDYSNGSKSFKHKKINIQI